MNHTTVLPWRIPRTLCGNFSSSPLQVPTPPSTSSSAPESDDFQDASDCNIHAALRASNDQIQCTLDQLKVNSARLQREIVLLQRHIGTLRKPVFETWEADILTRLIEIAHVHQHIKLPAGVSIGQANRGNAEALSQAYVSASFLVHEGTLRQLGLDLKYGKALRRYHEIVQYRSPNPFQTESQFAQWLVGQKDDRPEKFAFWSKLFPVCYGRTVERSAALQISQY